jgi:zinc transporter ZupT
MTQIVQTISGYFETHSPILIAFLATLFTWFLTAVGASPFFLCAVSTSGSWMACWVWLRA